MDINELDEEAMFIELSQLPDPVGEFHILLFQVQGVLVRLFLMNLLVKTRFNEEGFTVSSEIIMGNHIGNDFQPDRSHPSPLFFHRKHKYKENLRQPVAPLDVNRPNTAI